MQSKVDDAEETTPGVSVWLAEEIGEATRAQANVVEAAEEGPVGSRSKAGQMTMCD